MPDGPRPPTRRAVVAGAAAAIAAWARRPARAASTDLSALAPALEELIEGVGVPSLSLAVLDAGGGISTVAVGRRSAEAPGEVTARTMYQAGTLTQPATAIVALVLAQNGVVDLDGDVRGYLERWRPAPSPFDEAGPAPTIRRLLGMTAGTGVPRFAGYAPGAPLPGLMQILSGTPPATSPPLGFVAPAGRFLPSSGGYEMLEAALEDASGQDFGRLVTGLVIAPADMGDSTIQQPLPDRLGYDDWATGHAADGTALPGGCRIMPERAATGLWSTPADLASFMRALSDAWRGDSWRLRGRALLDPHRARTLFAAVDGQRYGCGGAVAGSGEALSFQKRGRSPGFEGYLVLFPTTGQGAAMMTNGEAGGGLAARLLPLLGIRFAWPELPALID